MAALIPDKWKVILARIILIEMQRDIPRTSASYKLMAAPFDPEKA